MQPAKSLKVGILALLLAALTIFPGCGGTAPAVNHSPTIIIITADSSSIDINQSNTITCIATDQDGDTLTYIWTKNGGTITGTGSTITWTAPATTGNYTITCTVSDGKSIDIQIISITVTEPQLENHSPVIISTAITSATVGEAYTYDVDATDPDGDTLTYSLTTYPFGISINSDVTIVVVEEEPEEECIPDLISPLNGAVLDNGCSDHTNLMTWKFDWSDCSSATCYHLYVMGPTATIPAVDNDYITNSNYTREDYSYVNTNRFNWRWKVRAMVNGQWGPWSEERYFDVEPLNTDQDNHPPQITSTPVTSATVGEAYTYDVAATDPDGDTLTYSLLAAPTGMTINSSTGLINWIPTAAGSFGVTVKVSDGELSDSQSFTIVVNDYLEDMSEEYYQETNEVFNLSEQKLNELVQAPPSDVETCLEILGDYLIEQSDVESYEVFGDSLKVIFDSGSYSTITLIDLDSSSPIASGGVNNLDNDNILKQTERLFSNHIYNDKKTTGKNITTFESVKKDNYFIKSGNKEDVEYIENCSVIIWAPFETYFTQYGNGSVSEYAEILNESGQYFDINTYTDHEADIEALKTITNYGIVILDSHGSSAFALTTGEVPDEFNIVKYEQELQPPDQEIYIDERIGVSCKDGKVEKYEERYVVTADWFGETLNENFPNSIVFNQSCESAIQPCYLDLYFRLYGAATYYGNSALSHNSFGHARVKKTLEGLVNGKTTGKAYEEESETFWHWEAWHLSAKVTNTWEMFGKDNVKILMSINEDDTNHPPVISDLSADPPSVDIKQTTTITCVASDPDGDPLTYHWTKNGGAFIGSTSGPSVTWRAPSTTDIFYIVVGCDVSDGKGGEDTETLNIVVTESEEMKIKNVINGLYQAMSNKDFDKARSYCVYGSVTYNDVNEMEQAYYDYCNSPDFVIVDHIIVDNISSINVNGQYAEAYVYITSVFIYNGEVMEYSAEGWLYLQKIVNDWKVYDDSDDKQKNDLIEFENIFMIYLNCDRK